ncbi:hypothetical protein F4803DRAFT_570256 [Xylaria telfairii]|nr:hypothetical protein F4803DRAFT_570256 [Xylaria telfairii]
MADNKKVKEEFNNGYLDESLIDPRLRPHTPETQRSEYPVEPLEPGLVLGPTLLSGAALAPATTAPTQVMAHDFDLDVEMDIEGDAGLPASAYQSLDFIVGSDDMVHDETERLWLIGLQAGIGLGIAGAREAVLNEMMYENTVFSRPIQSYPSDPDPYDMRMYLGQRCMTGFDLRVAARISRQFVNSSLQLIDLIVDNGLTACLPEYGSPLPGTFAFFTDEDSARCHENSRSLDEALELAGVHQQPGFGLENDVDIEQPASFTASFKGDSRFIGGLDMMQLTGTAALVANAVNEKNRARCNGPVMPNQQAMTRGPEPGFKPHVSHLTGDAHLSGHLGNDHQGYKTKYDDDDAYNSQEMPNNKPKVKPEA